MNGSIPEKLRNICALSSSSLRQALSLLEESHKEIVLVVDECGRLLGTVTDGDARRAVLRGVGLDEAVKYVMHSAPITGRPEMSRRECMNLIKKHRILQLPVLDDRGVVVDLLLLSEMVQDVRLEIPLSSVDFTEDEFEAVNAVLRSGWLTMGETTKRFEAEFAAFVGAKHAVAVTNGTAALHMALLALGIGEGDEVICPALSFVATANAVLYTGARPVFAEVKGEGDLTIDPSDIERRISPATRAIVVMHYGGYPCDMPAITEIARKHGLRVVEDAAHAPGATIGGRNCGTWGEMGCFSFFSNKNMTTGEGGMVTTDADELAVRLRHLRSHGMTSLTLDRHQGRAYSYDVVALGYNYRLDEIRAALGVIQVRSLAARNERRSDLTASYRSRLGLLPEVIIPFSSGSSGSACHILPVLLPEHANREHVMRYMREGGVQTSVHYPAINQFSYYRKRYPAKLPVTEGISRRELTLPLFPEMRDEQVDQVVAVLQDALYSEF